MRDFHCRFHEELYVYAWQDVWYFVNIFGFRFYFDNRYHIFDVRLMDRIDIICPTYKKDYPDEKIEYSSIYLVSTFFKFFDPDLIISSVSRSIDQVTNRARWTSKTRSWSVFVLVRIRINWSRSCFASSHHRRTLWNFELTAPTMLYVSTIFGGMWGLEKLPVDVDLCEMGGLNEVCHAIFLP